MALVCSANAGPRDNTGAPAFPSTPRRDAAAASRYHAGSAADSGPATGGFSCRCSPLGFVGMTTQTNADEHPGVCPGCGASWTVLGGMLPLPVRCFCTGAFEWHDACPGSGVPGHGLMGARVRPLRRGASADGAGVAGHRPSPPAGVVSARGSDGDDGGHGLYDTTRVTRKSDLARSPISFEHGLWTPIWRRVAGETDGVLNRSLLDVAASGINVGFSN